MSETIITKLKNFDIPEVNSFLDVLINTDDLEIIDGIIWAITLIIKLNGIKSDTISQELKDYIKKTKWSSI